jgi:hypothetical protein
MSDLRARLLSLKAQNAQLAIEAQEKAKEAQQIEKEFKFIKEDFEAVKERGPDALRETELNRFKDKERELKQQNERLQQLLKDTLTKAPASKANSHTSAKSSSKQSAPSVRSSSSKSSERPPSAARSRPATAATSVSAVAHQASPASARAARSNSPASSSTTVQKLTLPSGSKAAGTPTLAPSSADTMLRNELRFELQSKDREIAYNEKRSEDAQRALDKAREKVICPSFPPPMRPRAVVLLVTQRSFESRTTRSLS